MGVLLLNQKKILLSILFSNCYEPENTVVGIQEGQLLSTVHLRQYNINVRGAIFTY